MDTIALDEDVVFVYGRASSDPDDLRISVNRQIDHGQSYAAERWPGVPVMIFRDDDITAAKAGVVRPDFNRMLSELRRRPKGKVRGLWSNEQSRLTRLGETGWDDLRLIFNRNGLREVHTNRQGVISVEPGKSAVGRIQAVLDSEEAERVKARTKDAHDTLFAEGRPSGRAPFGFRLVKDSDGRSTYEQDPEAAPWVKQLFEWATEGVAIKVMAERLNQAGVLPRAAGFRFKKRPRSVTTWHPNTVRTVLRSAAVAGLRAHTDEEGVRHTVPAVWSSEAIVSEETWRQVQRIIGEPATVIGSDGRAYKVRGRRPPATRSYLLSGGRRRRTKAEREAGITGDVYGILRCGRCGQPLVAQTQSRRDGARVPAYQCHPKLTEASCGGVSISPAAEVERVVVAAVQAELARSRKLRARLDASAHKDAAALRARRDGAKRRMLDAAAMWGGSGDDSWRAAHDAAKAVYDEAVAALGELSTDLGLPSAEDVIDRWEALTLARKRAVLEHLIEAIYVAPADRRLHGFDEARLSAPVWRR